MEKEELSVVTEIGVFGDLDIEDPTAIDVKKKKKALDDMIEESISENKEALIGQ